MEKLPFFFSSSNSRPKLEKEREMLTQRTTGCISQIPKLRYQSIKYLSASVCPLSTLVYLIFFIVIVCLDLDLSPWPKV